MNDFFPIILIEVIITFGGVLFLYWWSMRDIRLWKEKKRDKQKKNKEERISRS